MASCAWTDRSPQGRFDRTMEQLDAAKSPEQRFYALDDAAKEGFVLGKIDEARQFFVLRLTVTV
jgi:hypothetical protein